LAELTGPGGRVEPGQLFLEFHASHRPATGVAGGRLVLGRRAAFVHVPDGTRPGPSVQKDHAFQAQLSRIASGKHVTHFGQTLQLVRTQTFTRPRFLAGVACAL